jgi:hypothetical protein
MTTDWLALQLGMSWMPDERRALERKGVSLIQLNLEKDMLYNAQPSWRKVDKKRDGT